MCLAYSGCGNSFAGNSIKNPDRLYMNISYMNGKTEHNLYLKKGDVLSVIFKTTGGKLTMEIKNPDGEVFYSGNGKDVTEFTLNVTKDGKHVVYINAEKAKGKIDIKKS